MENNTFLLILAVFVAVSAVALCIQAGFLFGIYMATKRLQEKVEPLVPKVDLLIESARTTIDQSRKQIVDITIKTNEILDSTKNQLKMVEGVVNDATSRARVQMERVEMVLDDTMSRAHETVATVHTGILRPLREINGIAVGVRAAIGHLARGGRPSVAQATSDEEMFI
jgi:hypothetical protein